MLFVYPTETCYGLGCSAFDSKNIDKIYKLKGRDSNKPLIVLVDSIEMWKSIAEVSSKALELAEKYWPGPLTIIQPKKSNIPDNLAKEEVAVRFSSHPVPNKIINELNAPIVSTSANFAGGRNPYGVDEIPITILRIVDKVIDDGELFRRPPSTVVRIDNDEVRIVRQGSVKI